MKKIIFTLVFCFATLFSYSQIPSINEKKVKNYSVKTESETKGTNDSIKAENNKKPNIKTEEEKNYKAHYEKKKDSIIYIINKLIEKQKKVISDRNAMIQISEEIEENRIALEKIELEKKRLHVEKRYWLPTKNSNFRNHFYETHYASSLEKTTLLNSFSATLNDNSNIVQSELIADRCGWFRVSFGSVLSVATDTTKAKIENDNLERLIGGGGNFYLDFTLPIITSYTDAFFTDYLYLSCKAASDISGFGNNVDVSTFNGSIGLTNYIGLSTEEKKFNFFLLTDVTAYKGNNAFYDNLKLNHNRWFLNSNISFGVTLLNNYRIICRTNLSSEPSLRTEKFAVGIQLLSSK
ncbi:hypothetical protein [Flavobacterium urocaniciphilum]|uniref:Secreted protein n=1 Tax=Flavobacterium urocaniciphilum TaxID=1299341 RepID=A0A1H9CT65_9FLAO|nr:hypothetical protein [Flavobacterium urocaniciphilum]SEQ04410.1 hypothetical protein SAMN05444005_10570 [Flavobacterium urocaniciphilum]